LIKLGAGQHPLRGKRGNLQAQSKDIILLNWNVPTTPRQVMGFIGFAIFYLRWCPWFEMKIKPMQDSISEQTINHVFNSSEFGANTIKAFHDIFSFLGLGFSLVCQPADSAELIAAMN
jgi:hypothetical protein